MLLIVFFLQILIIQDIVFQGILSAKSSPFVLEKRGDDRYLMPKNGKHSQTIIFLHGIGDSAAGVWYTLFHENKNSLVPSDTKIVLLTAIMNPITVGNNAVGPSWFDVKTFDFLFEDIHQIISIEELKRSQTRINAVIEEEIELLGGDSKRIVLMGFSQGVLMSLHTGLEFNKPLGGIVGWCGNFLPVTQENEANAEVPILLANGMKDEIVEFEQADKLYKNLDSERHKIMRINEPDTGHAINDNIVLETKKFLRKIFQDDQVKLVTDL